MMMLLKKVHILALLLFSSLFLLSPLYAQQPAVKNNSGKKASGWEAFASLVRGNLRFVQGLPAQHATDYKKRAGLLEQETVSAVVVTCSDAHVVPEIIFDQGLGQIFVVRTAGLAQDDMTVASVEHAITELGARLVVFLGSDSCSGIGDAASLGQSTVELKKLRKIIEQQNYDTTTLEERLRGSPVKTSPVEIYLRNITKQYVERSDVIQKYAIPWQLLVAEATFSFQSGKVSFLRVGRPEFRDEVLTFQQGKPVGFASGSAESNNPAR